MTELPGPRTIATAGGERLIARRATDESTIRCETDSLCGWNLAGAALGIAVPTPTFAAAATYNIGLISNISASCSGQNAEVEQAVDSDGYAQYIRAFSVTRGWLSGPVQVSAEFGDTSVWPGDTFGISTLASNQLVLSWGSAIPASGKKSEIFATTVGVQLP